MSSPKVLPLEPSMREWLKGRRCDTCGRPGHKRNNRLKWIIVPGVYNIEDRKQRDGPPREIKHPVYAKVCRKCRTTFKESA